MADLDNDITEARIDTDDVEGGGFQTELDTEAIKEHIVTAYLVVEDELTGNGLSDQRLARIEVYLTRHLIRFGPERQVDSEGSGPSNREYSGAFSKEGLEGTSPGQMALELDSTNTLGRETFSFHAVGGSDSR